MTRKARRLRGLDAAKAAGPCTSRRKGGSRRRRLDPAGCGALRVMPKGMIKSPDDDPP